MKKSNDETFNATIGNTVLCDGFLIPMTDFVIVKSLGENYLINKEGVLYSLPRNGTKGGFLKEQTGEFYKFYRVTIKNKRRWKEID